MGKIAFQVVGAAVGVAFGDPMLGLEVGSIVGGILDPPHMPAQGQLSDLHVSGAGYGKIIPWVFGRARLGGTVIWASDLFEHRVEHQAASGAPITINYVYTADVAIAICRGPITAVEKIWGQDLLLYSSSNTGDQNVLPPDGTELSEGGTLSQEGTGDPDLPIGSGLAQSMPLLGDVHIYVGDEVFPDSLIQSIEDPSLLGLVPGGSGLCYVVIEDLLLSPWGQRLPNFSFQVNNGSQTVGTICQTLLEEAGMAAGDIDVSQANAAVAGMIVGRRGRASDLLAPLLRVYQYDLSETDDQLRVIPRGGVVASTVPESDLGGRIWSLNEREPPSRLTTRQAMDQELPFRLDLTYQSIERNYQTGGQSAVRYAHPNSTSMSTLDVDLVLDDTAAAQVAETLLYQIWLERTTYEFSLPISYVTTVRPAAVIEIPVNGVNTRVRVLRADVGLFAELRVTAVPDDPDILSQQVLGAITNPVNTPLVTLGSLTAYAWSSPKIKVADDDKAGFYVAVSCNPSSSWAGAVVYYQPFGTTDWVLGGTVPGTSVLGTTDQALVSLSQRTTTAPPYREDDTLLVTVVTPGTLQFVSQSAEQGAYDTPNMDNPVVGSNVALIGSEIVSYRDANTVYGGNPLPAGEYNLFKFSRGWRRTATNGHQSSEQFVSLSDGPVLFVPVDQGLVGEVVTISVCQPSQAPASGLMTSVTIVAPLTSGIYVPLTTGPPAAPDVVTTKAGAVIMVRD